MADDSSTPPSQSKHRWSGGSRFVFALVLLALVSIRVGLGAGISPSFLPYLVDDALFIAQAEALLDGTWMGDYDHRRLVKGPGYPLFLALTTLSGLGRRLSEDLLHGLASLLIYRLLRRLGSGRIPAALAFGLTLFHPVLFTESMTRVIRDGFYGSLTLIVMALASTIPLPATSLRRGRRALFAGLPLAWLWLTRGEGLWILPALAILLAASFWIDRREGISLRRRFLRGGGTAMLLFAPTVLALVAWTQVNEQHYGLALRQELKAPGFNAAMGAINRVAATQDLRYEPLSSEQRERLYEVSPAFAELRPLLDTAAYRGPATSAENGERMAIFRSWLIRDAVARLGYHESPTRAERFYRRLAAEINQACDEGLITAGEARTSQMPAFDLAATQKALHLAEDYARDLVALERDICRPGLRLPELAVNSAQEASFTRVLAQNFGRDLAGVFPRSAALRGLLHPLRYLALLLVTAAGLGVVMSLAGFRRRPLSVLSFVALAWLVALASRLALVALLEAAWFRNIENYLIPAYLLFPPSAALLAAAGKHALFGDKRLDARLESGLLLVLGVSALAAMVWRGPEINEYLPATSLLHDPNTGARVFGIGLRKAEDEHRPEYLPQRSHPELHLYRPRKELPPAPTLRVAMDLSEVEYGLPFLIDFVGQEPQGGRRVQSRLLAAKGRGLQHWRIPIPFDRLDHVRLRLPAMEENALRLLDFSVATQTDLPEEGPRPGADLRGELNRDEQELALSIVEAEPNVTYRVFLGRQLAPEGSTLPGIQGQAFINAEHALRDEKGAAFVFDLITDEFGRAERRIPWPAEGPVPGFAQGLAPQSLSAPTAIAILQP